MSNEQFSVAEVAFATAVDSLHALKLVDPKGHPPLELTNFNLDVRQYDDKVIFGVHSVELAAKNSNSLQDIKDLTVSPTLTEAIHLLKSGAISSLELVEDAIAIMDKTRNLGTVVAIDEDAVRSQARKFDQERAKGLATGIFHGLPITVKDVIDVAGLPTRAGSKAYYDLPSNDAASVKRLRDAGALIFAKVATHEFALGVTTPQCRNPFDSNRISGGSSGGSAIAVATGVGVASLGTDTRASLRVPSALCGVVGFKPTFGRVPTDGIVPLSWTIDHIGPITRSVQDAGLMLNVLADTELFNPSAISVELVGTRIGVLQATIRSADAEIVQAVESSFPILAELGAILLDVDNPSAQDLEIANSLGLLISRSEAATVHRAMNTELDLCIPEVRDQLREALKLKATDYLDAQRFRAVLAARTLSIFETCDVLVMPTVPIQTPLWQDYEKHLLHLSRNAIIWSLLGCPAVSMPVGATKLGMPIGLQLVAAPGNEAQLLKVGIALERAMKK